MHEILQRFSSLEKELTVVDRQAEKESGAKAQVALANLLTGAFSSPASKIASSPDVHAGL